MSIFEQFLDGREELPSGQDRDRAAEAWQLTGRRPEERLLAFDRWVAVELEARLDWGWAGAAKEKRVAQCRVCLERMVLDLWRRGWLLDGKRLAARIIALLDAVGTYQKRGGIQDFWTYFNAAVQRYVGANAEEIQAEAARAGGRFRTVMAALQSNAQPAGPALPELLAQRAAEIADAKEDTLRERMARERAKKAACEGQGELFGDAAGEP